MFCIGFQVKSERGLTPKAPGYAPGSKASFGGIIALGKSKFKYIGVPQKSLPRQVV